MIAKSISVIITKTNAEPKGQFLAVRNWSLIIFPIIGDFAPPNKSGITNSPRVGMKTKNNPVKIPDFDNGKVTFQNVFNPDAPKSFDAKYKLLSIFSIEA